MKLLHIVLLAAAAGFSISSGLHNPQTHYPKKDTVTSRTAFEMAFKHPCTKESCDIYYSPGGDVDVFKAAAEEVKGNAWPARIIGPCISACAIFADHARENVCILPFAEFHFHLGTNYVWAGFQVGLSDIAPLLTDWLDAPEKYARLGEYRPLSRFIPDQSPDIDQWVRDRGGYPRNGFLEMPFTEAVQFWQICA